jgi:hypothetical protein
MGEWPALQMLDNSAPPFRGIHGLDQARQGLDLARLLKGDHVKTIQEGLDCSPDLRPEFNLTRDRPVHQLAGQSRIQDQVIRELYRLTHE